MKTRLKEKDLATLISLSDKLYALRQRYNEEDGTDVALRIDGNGTVGSNLDCAMASIEVILQEFIY